MATFELNDQQIEIIRRALGAQPYDIVEPVISEMQRQYSEQKETERTSEPVPFPRPL